MNDYETYTIYIDGEQAITVYGKNIQIVPTDSMENRIEVKQHDTTTV